MNLTGITALEKSKWVKLDAVWKTDKTFLLYVNGAQTGTGTLKKQAANGNQAKLALGGALAPTANDQKSGRGVYGDMDEIRLRAGALSPYYVRAVVSNTLDEVLTTPAISFATSTPGSPAGTATFQERGFTTLSATGAATAFGTGAQSATLRLEASTDGFATVAAASLPTRCLLWRNDAATKSCRTVLFC